MQTSELMKLLQQIAVGERIHEGDAGKIVSVLQYSREFPEFGHRVEGFQEHFGHIEPISFVCKNNPPSQSGSMNGASRGYIEQTGDDFPPEAKGIVNDVIGLQFPDFVKKLGDIFQRTPSENCG